MPKRSFPITNFKGLYTEADARDIPLGALKISTNVLVDKPGRIRAMSIGTQYNSLTYTAANMMPGYGLFEFSSDYNWASTPTESRTNYLLVQNANLFTIGENYDATVDWNTTDTNSTTLSLGSDTTNVIGVYYYVDGALRICDATFGNNNNDRKWLGYINRRHFSGISPGGTADIYEDWMLNNAKIDAPTRGLIDISTPIPQADNVAGATATNLLDTGAFSNWTGTHLDMNLYLAVNITNDESVLVAAKIDDDNLNTQALSGPWQNDQYYIFPEAGEGFIFYLEGIGKDGDIAAGTYEFASTFIYDDTQESLLYGMGGTLDIAATESITGHVRVTAPFNPRITGGRLYTRISGSSDDWIFIAEVSLENGVSISIDGEYSSWELLAGYSGVANYCMADFSSNIDSLSTLSYEMLSGLLSTEEFIDAKYKTACIANRRCYIGNIYQNQINYGDRMLKSPVNKFDTFPASNFVDVIINDGDDIISLVPFADRILQFKRRSLYVINISQDIEFLESSHPFMGINYSCQVYRGSDGVMWCNFNGVFYYDGQKIHELSIPIRADYQSFFAIDNAIPSLGYDEQYKKIIISQSADGLTGVDDSIYCFDFNTKSWTYGINIYTELSTGQHRTNFTNSSDGRMIVLEYDNNNNYVMQWTETGAITSDLRVVTQDVDFGKPGVDKRVYALDVTYKCDTTANVNVRFYYNGDNNSTSSTALNSTSASWTKQRIDITPASNKSIRAEFVASGSVPSTFEINDMSFVYRMLGER